MESEVTYFTVAENDYPFLKDDYERGKIGAILCYVSQNICARYLKHIITISDAQPYVRTMRTHSLRVLKDFFDEHIPEFQLDWDTVLLADNYYISARYPGDDCIFVTKKDVDECWRAVIEVRSAVIDHMQCQKKENVDILKEIHAF